MASEALSTATRSQVYYIPDVGRDDSDGMSVEIVTERLILCSVRGTKADYENYFALYSNERVMQLFANGETQSFDYVKNRIDTVWAKRWSDGDPYSAFAVFLKGESFSSHHRERGNFIGHIVLGHSGTPGQAELAGMGFPEYWNKGYGKEATQAVVKEYAPATVEWACRIDGEPLHTIVATASPLNPASCRILESIGMTCFKTEERFGSMRFHYQVSLRSCLV